MVPPNNTNNWIIGMTQSFAVWIIGLLLYMFTVIFGNIW